MLKGITVTLYERTQSGIDDFNSPVYTETPVSVNNVLVAPLSSQEITDTLNLYGAKAVYQLAIPKGDTHDWYNKKVKFFNEYWKTVGIPLKGIDELIPGNWNTKVQVERYE